MRRIIPGLLIATLVATGGCLLSSDEDDRPSPKTGWQPELWVTPDSVSAFFPSDWPDTTTFTWNVYPRGVPEYTMDAVVRVATADWHIAFIRQSDGGPRQTGTFAEMAQGAAGWMWASDPTSGARLGQAWPFNEIRLVAGGTLVRAFSGAARFMYASPPVSAEFWPVTFLRTGMFEPRKLQKRIQYSRDRAQLRAKEVNGLLSADDYVVMNLVLKTYLDMHWPNTVVVSNTLVVPKLPRSQYNFMERDIDWIGPDHDTRASFDVMRYKRSDISALAQLGWIIGEEDAPPVDDTLYIQLSAIGYNHARTQALMYGTYYCGMLCAAGDLYLLEKIDGYWVIKGIFGVWIS